MATLNFDSRKNYSKISQRGNTTLTLSGTTFRTSTTIAHGLGYVPMCRVWFTNKAGYICPATSQLFAELGQADFQGTNIDYECEYYIDSTNLTIAWDRLYNVSISSTSITVYYRIYYDVVS